MINKKNVLGKEPAELGIKDAIHTGIVSLRAGKPIEPGTRCGVNEHGEAVPNPKGPGVADPFRKSTILRGQAFWLLLSQEEIPNVRHEWDHPEFSFAKPTREVVKNLCIKSYADDLGVTYEQLMDAATLRYVSNKFTPYPGTLTQEEYEEKIEELERWDFWSEWSEETLNEFENHGTECCPEYDYPDLDIFTFDK